MWHAGEQAAQARADGGVKVNADGLGPLKPQMTERHQAFFRDLTFVVVGALDRAGNPWASVATGASGFGAAGFIASPDPQTLTARTCFSPADALGRAIAADIKLALLGIDFTEKRRNRVNGRITATHSEGFTIHVEQAYGNCPQYIQDHDVSVLSRANRFEAHPLFTWDDRARQLIAQADAFFVASTTRTHSQAPDSGMDVSHRGGPKGFARIAGDGSLIVPDYAGNGYFNTLGNMVDWGRAGLLFLDFSTGDRLQITGAVHIQWKGAEVDALPGAERLWRLTPTAARWMTAQE